MVGFDMVATRGTDFTTMWANYEGLGLRVREGTTHSLHLVEIEPVRNEDSNAP